MTLHSSSSNSPLQKAIHQRSDAACAAAITHALKYHYQLLVTTANAATSTSSTVLLERVTADACLRAAEFTVDPKVIEAVMLPPSTQGGSGGAEHHHRRQSGMDELASSHSSAGVLMFMKGSETVEAVRALQRLEDSNPYAYFSSAILRSGSRSGGSSSPVTEKEEPMGKLEGSSDVDDARVIGGDITSLSQLLPSRYILHALAARLHNTPSVLDDPIAEEARNQLQHLFLEGVHGLLASLQAVVRLPGESYPSLDLAKSIWFAAPPGLSTNNSNTNSTSTACERPLTNEEAFDRDMSGGGDNNCGGPLSKINTSPSSPTPPSMRVVLLYNLLVGRLYDDYFDEDAFTEYQMDGLVERVERGLCASILSTDHPLSLQFGVSKSSGTGTTTPCGVPCEVASSSSPTRFQAALGKAIHQERSRFGRLCYRFKGGEKRGRSDQSNSMRDDEDDEGMYNIGRRREVYVPDPNEIDPRIQRWGPPTASSRRIRFIDDIPTPITTPTTSTTASHNTSRTTSPPHSSDNGAPGETYRSFMTGGMGLVGRRGRGRSSNVSSVLEEVFMVPTFHSQYGLQ